MRLIDADAFKRQVAAATIQNGFAKAAKKGNVLMELIDMQPTVTDWIPVEERLPEDSKYILLSFSNFSIPAVGRYEKDEEGGAFYLGDCDEEDTCVTNDLFVNAWMPLPEPYRPEPGKE